MRKILVAISAILLGVAGAAQAGDVTELRTIGEGRAIYLQNCTGCHGTDARGMTVANAGPVPDLTLIAARDVSFDRLHVKNHILFGNDVQWRERQASEMPRWGVVLAQKGSRRNDAAAQLAVLKLLRYVEFVQQEEPSAQRPR